MFFLGITMSLSFHKLLSALHFINHTLTHFDPEVRYFVVLVFFFILFYFRVDE